ncbi:cytochrome b/b6 domain-containing protein [Shewanella atlantica]|uniref:Cytochrome B n=1 Tax=Shewanella atlantica TaxID=271099 RepID=A0A431WGR8_9GAMM|nr:cytochrome b/b6 domain-containing protein [Shewanella atlantica]RTR34654.1 cytochrome B [Shewanella atlantica]
MQTKIKVWDLPVRIFHWGMIALLGGLWWTADAGEMEWHQVLAYCLMVFIIFRLVWGIVGSDTARFSQFIKHPKTVLGYVKYTKHQGVSASIGHNPLGGYMVLALIALVTMQLSTGLFSTDEIFTEGPLYSFVSSETGASMSWLHKKIFYVMLGFAAVHVLAVIFHGVKGDKLVRPMLSGYKQMPGKLDVELTFKPLLMALVLLMAVGGVVTNYLIWPIIEML